MNIEDHLQGMPREKLLRLMAKAEKNLSLSADEMPEKYATSEDIIMIIEDLGRYRGIVYDPATDELIEGKPQLSDDETEYSRYERSDDDAGVTLGEVLMQDIGNDGP